MPLIALDDVSTAFGHVPLLDHATLTIEAGERIALIGRNGTGKSTLLRILAGELVPDAGSVRRGSNVQIVYVDQPREELDATIAGAEFYKESRSAITGVLDRAEAVRVVLPEQRLCAPISRSPLWQISSRRRHGTRVGARRFASCSTSPATR